MIHTDGIQTIANATRAEPKMDEPEQEPSSATTASRPRDYAPVCSVCGEDQVWNAELGSWECWSQGTVRSRVNGLT